MERKNRGQVAIWAVVGVILAGSLILAFSITKSAEKSFRDQNDIEDFIEECVKEQAFYFLNSGICEESDTFCLEEKIQENFDFCLMELQDEIERENGSLVFAESEAEVDFDEDKNLYKITSAEGVVLEQGEQKIVFSTFEVAL